MQRESEEKEREERSRGRAAEGLGSALVAARDQFYRKTVEESARKTVAWVLAGVTEEIYEGGHGAGGAEE